MNTNMLILALCVVVMLSYLFNIISKQTRIPSVLWLLGTGILFNWLDGENVVSDKIVNKLVEVLGTIGLIMIILEAALDLHIAREKLGNIVKALISAVVILFASSFSIAYIIFYWLKEPFQNCLIYATPLSIVSSAILIPSIGMLSQLKKEFIIYEASFSDIIGILYFNYLIGTDQYSLGQGIVYLGQMGLSIILSVIVAVILIYLLGKIKLEVKFFLIFAVLIALYSFGKIIHLPSLLIILFFGLIINNRQLLQVIPKIELIIPDNEKFKKLEFQIKTITFETSFLVRTFFFMLFGYAIDLQKLVQNEVMIVGGFIVLALLLVRLIYLLYLNPRESPLPELFLMPRGLITILLFYNIPVQFRLLEFNNGILFFVILVTSFMMMIGLFTAKNDLLEETEIKL